MGQSLDPAEHPLSAITEDGMGVRIVSHPMAASQPTARVWLAHRYDGAMTAEDYSPPCTDLNSTPPSLLMLQPTPRLALAEVPDGSPGFELGRPGPGLPSPAPSGCRAAASFTGRGRQGAARDVRGRSDRRWFAQISATSAEPLGLRGQPSALVVIQLTTISIPSGELATPEYNRAPAVPCVDAWRRRTRTC